MNEALYEAVTNAMYRYTFGIVANGMYGAEGCGLGTGIGLRWKDHFLILTAAHTMEKTPDEKLYFLFPAEGVVVQGSSIPSDHERISIGTRRQLESVCSVLDSERDLVVFVLPKQSGNADSHFYALDEFHAAPTSAVQLGIMGYPESTRLPAGKNFMLTPYSSFGPLMAVPKDCNPLSQM